MLTLARKVLIVLLMVAMPMQGFAAAGMLACAQGHGQMHQIEAIAPLAGAEGTVAEITRAAHDHGSHSHGHADSSYDVPQAPAIDDEPDVSFAAAIVVIASPATDGAQDATCSACAACCVGAAIVARSVFARATDISSAPLLAACEARVSFITDGPVRPPRSFLA
ncbi:MAG: hypothetical protein ACKVQK_01110 [Burkholderiales bacterium]